MYSKGVYHLGMNSFFSTVALNRESVNNSYKQVKLNIKILIRRLPISAAAADPEDDPVLGRGGRPMVRLITTAV
jgi:hypothetical protein